MIVSQPLSRVQKDALGKTIKMLFTDIACQIARDTGFVKRKSPITGAAFAQTLVFGFLDNPDASYTDLKQMLGMQGIKVSAQALEKRMTETAALFLLRFLERVVEANITQEKVSIELLERFHGVYLQDGSIIGLPAELESHWKGFGGNTEKSGKSAVRIQVRLNLQNGRMQGPWLQSAKDSERSGISSFEETPAPEGSLSIVDSGHFKIERMKWLEEQKRYWLTHAKADLIVTNSRGIRQTIPEMLHACKDDVIDEEVMVGSKNQLKCRFIAFRVEGDVAKKRKESLNTNSKEILKGSRSNVLVHKGKPKPLKKSAKRVKMGKKRAELYEWTFLLTNVPASTLNADEARVLMRSRWQIELIWKLWKEHGLIDVWRSEKPARILCEIYAKLIGQVIQHWLIVTGCWHQPHRSIVKAAKAVRKLVNFLVKFIKGKFSFREILRTNKDMMDDCKIDTRRKHPNTSQRLLSPGKKTAKIA